MEQVGWPVVPSVGLSILGIGGLTAGSRGCALDSSWLTLTTGLLLNEVTALLIIANGLRLLRNPRPIAAPSRTAAAESKQLAGEAEG